MVSNSSFIWLVGVFLYSKRRIFVSPLELPVPRSQGRAASGVDITCVRLSGCEQGGRIAKQPLCLENCQAQGPGQTQVNYSLDENRLYAIVTNSIYYVCQFVHCLLFISIFKNSQFLKYFYQCPLE